jgi:hypothetical protein
VATTAMVWSAVAGSVGLVNGRFQRQRTGALDRLQTFDLTPPTVHTGHRCSGSQLMQRSARCLHSESYSVGTGCVPTLGSGGCGVTRRVAGFHGFFIFASRRGTSRQAHDSFALSEDSCDQNIPHRPVYFAGFAVYIALGVTTRGRSCEC